MHSCRKFRCVTCLGALRHEVRNGRSGCPSDCPNLCRSAANLKRTDTCSTCWATCRVTPVPECRARHSLTLCCIESFYPRMDSDDKQILPRVWYGNME